MTGDHSIPAIDHANATGGLGRAAAGQGLPSVAGDATTTTQPAPVTLFAPPARVPLPARRAVHRAAPDAPLQTMSTIMVTTVADTGAGSLRKAITTANNDAFS